jgi:hypothetical protein
VASSEHAPELSDSLGRYRYSIHSPLGPFAACVSVWGRIFSDTTLRAETTSSAAALRFRPDYPSGGPHDSVTIDLVLRRR